MIFVGVSLQFSNVLDPFWGWFEESPWNLKHHPILPGSHEHVGNSIRTLYRKKSILVIDGNFGIICMRIVSPSFGRTYIDIYRRVTRTLRHYFSSRITRVSCCDDSLGSRIISWRQQLFNGNQRQSKNYTRSYFDIIRKKKKQLTNLEKNQLNENLTGNDRWCWFFFFLTLVRFAGRGREEPWGE